MECKVCGMPAITAIPSTNLGPMELRCMRHLPSRLDLEAAWLMEWDAACPDFRQGWNNDFQAYVTINMERMAAAVTYYRNVENRN